MQIIGDVLYAQVGQHLFAIHPTTGKVLWQIDAAKATGLRYERAMYGGELDIAVFTRDADVLVVAYEGHVFAMQASTGSLRWHLASDTFPHCAFPLAKDGIVYLTSRAARRSAVILPKKAK